MYRYSAYRRLAKVAVRRPHRANITLSEARWQDNPGAARLLQEQTVTAFGGHGLPASRGGRIYRRLAEKAEQRRTPQTAQTVWQPGSMQWLAEQMNRRRSGTSHRL
jgi:hypothetical protein